MDTHGSEGFEHTMKAVVFRRRVGSRLPVAAPDDCYFTTQGHVEFIPSLRCWPKDLDRRTGTEQSGTYSEKQTIQFRYEQTGPRTRLGGDRRQGAVIPTIKLEDRDLTDAATDIDALSFGV